MSSATAAQVTGVVQRSGQAAQAKEAGLMRVLIVEDEPIIALNIRDTLLDLGYRPVGPAGSIADATQLAQTAVIDAAILDISLPDGESFALADKLLNAGVAILFATGRDYDPRSHAMPGVAMISKPFDIASLAAALEKIKAGLHARPTTPASGVRR
jgi:DNA-binding response OmpR family regulator